MFRLSSHQNDSCIIWVCVGVGGVLIGIGGYLKMSATPLPLKGYDGQREREREREIEQGEVEIEVQPLGTN